MPDDELDRIKKKQVDEFLKYQQEKEIREQIPVVELDSLNFYDVISQNKLFKTPIDSGTQINRADPYIFEISEKICFRNYFLYRKKMSWKKFRPTKSM